MIAEEQRTMVYVSISGTLLLLDFRQQIYVYKKPFKCHKLYFCHSLSHKYSQTKSQSENHITLNHRCGAEATQDVQMEGGEHKVIIARKSLIFFLPVLRIDSFTISCRLLEICSSLQFFLPLFFNFFLT